MYYPMADAQFRLVCIYAKNMVMWSKNVCDFYFSSIEWIILLLTKVYFIKVAVYPPFSFQTHSSALEYKKCTFSLLAFSSARFFMCYYKGEPIL